MGGVMSSIVLSGDTSGTIILDAPAVAGTNTILFPALTGTVLTNKTVGTVLQVVQTTKTDTFSTTSTSKTDITGMSVSITPSSASSKILIIVSLSYGGNDYNFYCDLLRNSTRLNIPSSGVNPCTIALNGITTTTYQIFQAGISFLDSPATTSATTYKLQVACQPTGSFRLNRSERNGAADATCSSTITAMEIAA